MEPWFGISAEDIGPIGAAINLVITVLVSLATKPRPAEMQRLIADIRYPAAERRVGGRAGAQPKRPEM